MLKNLQSVGNICLPGLMTSYRLDKWQKLQDVAKKSRLRDIIRDVKKNYCTLVKKKNIKSDA